LCVVVVYFIQTELFDGVLDGRMFRATDVVTFPPDGWGIATAFATSIIVFILLVSILIVSELIIATHSFYLLLLENFCKNF